LIRKWENKRPNQEKRNLVLIHFPFWEKRSRVPRGSNIRQSHSLSFELGENGTFNEGECLASRQKGTNSKPTDTIGKRYMKGGKKKGVSREQRENSAATKSKSWGGGGSHQKEVFAGQKKKKKEPKRPVSQGIGEKKGEETFPLKEPAQNVNRIQKGGSSKK